MNTPRWYMVNKDGMATLCADREDAEKEAADAQSVWPHMGPHRAVQLIEASFEAADMATAAAQEFRDGVASAAAPTPPAQAQAGAVPLTDEQIEALPMWKRFVGLWPETRREIVRTIEHHHGIKGGLHGTE